MLRRSLIVTAASLAAPRAFAQRGQESFEITASETATIDGRQWDTPMPGGTTMDAVHRSVLLRFPGAADQIADPTGERSDRLQPPRSGGVACPRSPIRAPWRRALAVGIAAP